jgi:hypothetical protein
MNTKVTVKTGFGVLSDAQAIATAGAVIKGLYAEKSLATAPVDQATLQTAVDNLNGSIATLQAQGGGMAATTTKNKYREALDGLLRKLAHHVQANCNDDVQIVLNSGFQARTTSVRSQTPLGKVQIVSVDNGHTTQLVVKVKKLPRAKAYEVRSAAVVAGNTVGPFQQGGLFTDSRSITITGLTPGTVYAVQVRACGGSNKAGDWSDAVNHMCM